MTETLVIQSDSNGYLQLEAFIENVCSFMCADNEHGIISMAILQSFSVVTTQMENDNPVQLHIECGSCVGGMFFCMTDNDHVYDFSYRNEMPLEGVGQMLFTINRLADKVQMINNGHTLRLEFNLSGVESPFSRRRQQVLATFHDMHIVEV